MKILWHSNAPWVRTGYGIQTNLLGTKISSLGHEIHYSSNYGLQGTTVALDSNSRVYPSLTTEQGDYVLLLGHAKTLNPDIVITLYDVWTMPYQLTNAFRWVPIVPIQWETTPERIRILLQGAFRTVAYSKFGVEKLQQAGINPLYLPHCVDTKIFYRHDKRAARETLSLPQDVFLALMVGMNKGFPSRKSFPEVIDAWDKFAKNHNDCHLHLHTCPSHVGGGVDLYSLIGASETTKKTITVSDPYEYFTSLETEKLALLYSAADVLLLPSQAEAFGVPLIEAQACGLPVITSNFGPMRELCFSGWLVDGQRNWDPMLSAWQFLPFTPAIVSCLEKAYEARCTDALSALSQRAIIHARSYDVEAVTNDYLIPLLATLEQALEGVGSLTTLGKL